MAIRRKPAPASKAIVRRTRGRVREEAEFPVPPTVASMPPGYAAVLADLKQRIQAAQSRAALAVNREMIALYWHVGRTVVERQTKSGWGESVVERLAHDLRQAFPDLAGFSPRNIWRMRAFYVAWSALQKKLPQPVAELPWGHNILLLEKLARVEDRLWYAERTHEHGWSRAALHAQIVKKVHQRQGKATTNFARTLATPQSELAQETLKDPYTFDFLTVGRETHERVTERDLVTHVREFLLELGVGFAFIGLQTLG